MLVRYRLSVGQAAVLGVPLASIVKWPVEEGVNTVTAYGATGSASLAAALRFGA
ncbi:MAG: hypothetical protein ACLT98_18130 [Eggerthellaceae bacterium]